MDNTQQQTPQQPKQNGIDECPICLTGLLVGRALFTTSCGHQFHFDCISKLPNFSLTSCPICRNPVPQLSNINTVAQTPASVPVAPVRPTNPFANVIQTQTTSYQLFGPSVSTTSSQNLDLSQFEEDPVDEIEVAKSLTRERMRSEQTIERTLSLNAILEKEQLSASTPAQMLGMLSIQAPPGTEDENETRAPLDLIVVVDTSGSMMGEKIALVRETLSFLLTQLTPADRFSLVGFESRARLYSIFQKVNQNKQNILIQQLRAGGGTSIASGFKAAIDVLNARKTRNPVSSMLLLTDGEDSGAMRDLPALTPLVPEGCSVHTFGYGKDHDAKILGKLAELTSGTFTYIEDNTTIAPAFGNCLGGLLTTVALGIQIEIHLCENVYLDKFLSHYKVAEKHPDFTLSLPDLFADEQRDIVISFNIPANQVTDKHVVATAVIRYKDALQSDKVLSTKTVEFSLARPETALLINRSNPKLLLQRKRITVADALTQALDYAQQKKFDAVKTIIENAARFVLEVDTLPSNWQEASSDPLLSYLLKELHQSLSRLSSQEKTSQGGYAYAQNKMMMLKQQRAQTSEETHYKTSLQKKCQSKFTKY